jgi:ATP-binding cassette subfamily C (CFTR/MRP) protein 4
MIQEKLAEGFKECTLITIAHRLETIAGYDKILVMQDGSPVEFDRPQNLIKNEKGHFRALVDGLGPVGAQAIKDIIFKVAPS